MSLRKYILLGLGLFLLLSIISMLANLYNLDRSNTALDNTRREIDVVLSLIDPINHGRTAQVYLGNAVRESEKGETAAAARSLALARQVLEKADLAFTRFVNSPLLPDEAALRERYRASYLQLRQQGLEPLMAAASEQDRIGYESARQRVTPLTAAFEQQLNDALSLHQRYSQQLENGAQRDFRLGALLSAVLLVIAITMMAWMLAAIRRGLISPIHRVVAVTEKIERGDLSVMLSGSSAITEVAHLNRAMSTMSAQLSEMVGGIRAIVDKVQQASVQIAQRNLNLDRRTQQQSCAVVETAASMEQIAATVKHTAENVRKASELSDSAFSHAEKGGEVINEVIATMNEIAESSSRITDITGVINGIADQTNILALNAAVEAARAGDQGRGFAVVAGEVRNLAQRSSQAAKEIAELIEESRSRVAAGSSKVSRAGASTAEILRQVGEVNQLMSEIAEASEQQSQGIAQIGQAIHELDTTTQQNADLVSQSSSDAGALEQDAGQLAGLVAAFRVAR